MTLKPIYSVSSKLDTPAGLPVEWIVMQVKLVPALLTGCGMLLLGASCAQPAKSVNAPDVTASKHETQAEFARKWIAEQKRRQKLAEQEAEAKRRYYAEYIRQHGYPTHADRERAIRDALRSSAR